MNRKANSIIRVIAIVLVVLIPASFAGITFARQHSMIASNEYINTVLPEPPKPTNPPPETPAPAETPPLPEATNKPKPSEPPAVTDPQTPHVPPEKPTGPFNPDDRPKTADNADPKTLLAALAIGIYLLRHNVFNRKGAGR